VLDTHELGVAVGDRLHAVRLQYSTTIVIELLDA
jgi:hypothetical protein